jgi:RTX calcium-binding nonapeptide repeat (4 copies)
MKTLKSIVLVTMFAAILIGGMPPRTADAADFTVTRTDDPSPDDPASRGCLPGDCSLREAVISANNTGGHDTIHLSNKVYSLLIPARFGDFGFAQVGDLDIHEDLTIEGPMGSSAKANIDANGATMGDRAFDISGADTDVTMRRLIITEGRAAPTGADNNGDGRPDFAYGGAIRIEEGASLSGDEIVLDRNSTRSIGQGGAIFNDGDLNLVRSQIRFNDAPDGFSGGIQTEPGATTSLYETEIYANDAVFGGGLGAYGITTIGRSAIYLNRAMFGGLGGGIRAAGTSSVTTLTNVTMAHNEAGGTGAAIQSRNGTGFTLNNVTIARNTSDSDGDGTGNAAVSLRRDNFSTSMTLRNTILAANEDGSPGSSDIPDCEVQGGATITAASYDLVGNWNGCNLTVPLGAPGIHVGDAANPVDPMLEIGINPNGGPTATLALLPGSPAINAASEAESGAEACEPSDQRGVPRADCDIGAYELVKCRDTIVNVVGTPGADVLRGSSRSDAILALSGADEVSGGGGNDVICAGGGKDALRGESGNDRLFGQDGGDTLNTRDGVQGNDLANGGSGTDSCRTDSEDRKSSC